MKTISIKLIILLTPILFFGLTSCLKDDGCVIGNGVKVTEERKEDDFNAVSVIGDYFQVSVHIGDSATNMILEGESNILDQLHRQYSDELDIQTYEDVCIEPTLPIKVDVFAPQINKIALTGQSSITTDTIVNDHFRVYMFGGGVAKAIIITDSLNLFAHSRGLIELEGVANRSYMTIYDDVTVKSYPLKQDTCFVSIFGPGKVYVHVENYLNVTIGGDGIVYYKGNPATIETDITGNGKVIQE
ncbi:MAG: hypothetical protein DRJ05_03115 [Bacteroidetes bacterium]|nr:MAG: hypothetical protein DRJ05_03115 [Bacteroidota bacterium]